MAIVDGDITIGVSDSRHAPFHLYTYKFTVVHELKPPDTLARFEFYRWFLSEVESSFLDSQFFISSGEAWFSSSGYANSHNMRYYTTSENPCQYLEESFHNLKLGDWCTMSGFFHQTVDAHQYISNQLNPFGDQLTEDEYFHGYFQ